MAERTNKRNKTDLQSHLHYKPTGNGVKNFEKFFTNNSAMQELVCEYSRVAQAGKSFRSSFIFRLAYRQGNTTGRAILHSFATILARASLPARCLSASICSVSECCGGFAKIRYCRGRIRQSSGSLPLL